MSSVPESAATSSELTAAPAPSAKVEVRNYRDLTGKEQLQQSRRPGLLSLEGASAAHLERTLSTIDGEHCDSIVLAHNQDLRDKHLHALLAIPGLKFVNFANTAISDNGIAVLATHPMLEELQLTGTQITDGAVEWLLLMPSLKKVTLHATGITKPAAERLRDALQARQPTAVINAYFS